MVRCATARSAATLIYLVAQYEFVPAANDVDGYVYGGRAQHWITDHLRIGVTGMSETTGTADQTGVGADVNCAPSQGTFLAPRSPAQKGPALACRARPMAG